MPLSEPEEEILFHQPAKLNETPDSADPQRKNAPPSKRVVRPSAESKLSDVIRHQPPPERAAAREAKAQQPAPAKAPAAASSTKVNPHEEFAAAAARARAAVNQQQLNSEAKKVAERTAAPARATGIPEARLASETQAQTGQRLASSQARQNPAPGVPAQPAPSAQTARPSQPIRQAEATRATPAARTTPAPQTGATPATPTTPTTQTPQTTPVVADPAPAKPQTAAPSRPADAPAQAANQAPAIAGAADSAGLASRAQAAAPTQARTAPVRAQVLAEPEPEVATRAAERSQPQAEPEPRVKREVGKSFLLHTHGLKKVYDGRAVVNGVDVTVRPSEIVGLLGPNGAGKTTTFYMIVGLIQPNGGSVTFNGKDATNQPMYKRARLGMGYLPQEESIFRKLSVEDNILAVMETQNVARSERRDRCHELMKRFGIERLAKNEAITLSGGEKRRLTIARSLVTNPKLLMLDEPFSGVDPIAVGEIQEIVRSLREQGLAILITDHNVRETLDIVDRAYLLFEGRVEREGTRDFLINDPLSRQLYLGERFSM